MIALFLTVVIIVIVTNINSQDDSASRRSRSSQLSLNDRVMRILDKVPLIDGHNDLPWQIRIQLKNQIEKVRLT